MTNHRSWTINLKDVPLYRWWDEKSEVCMTTMDRFLKGFTEDCDLLKRHWDSKMQQEEFDEFSNALSGVISSYEDSLAELKKKEDIVRKNIHDESKLLIQLAGKREHVESKLQRLKDRMEEMQP